jgi:hypothetical protein
MSTIKTTTLSTLDGAATVPVNTVVNGSAKAWVNFNGAGTVAIRAAFNVSSITDNGTGDYTVNFTTAMSDANYAITAQNAGDTGYGSYGVYVFQQAAPTTSGARISTRSNAGTYADPIQVNVAIFR